MQLPIKVIYCKVNQTINELIKLSKKHEKKGR